MSDMDDFLLRQVEKAYEREPSLDAHKISGLKHLTREQANALDAKRSFTVQLEQDVARLRSQLAEAQQEVAATRSKLKKAETAKAQYTAGLQNQEKVTLEWMVSQKAFKALAMEFGIASGLPVEKIIEMGNRKKIDVLDNKHDPEHGTNANGLPYLAERIDQARALLTKK